MAPVCTPHSKSTTELLLEVVPVRPSQNFVELLPKRQVNKKLPPYDHMNTMFYRVTIYIQLAAPAAGERRRSRKPPPGREGIPGDAPLEAKITL